MPCYFKCSRKFLHLKKVELYLKLLQIAKNYETWLWKCCENRKCIIFYCITKKMSSLGILDPIFQIAQWVFLLRDLKWNLLFLYKIKMTFTKKYIFIIPNLWIQKNIANSLWIKKISNRAVAGRFEMVLSDFNFFLTWCKFQTLKLFWHLLDIRKNL